MFGRVARTISLSPAISGRKVMDAVKKLSPGGEYHEEIVSRASNRTIYEIGRNSMHPAKGLIIKDGNKDSSRIDPKGSYEKLTVEYHKHPGRKFAVGFGTDAVVRAIKEFQQQLKTELESQ